MRADEHLVLHGLSVKRHATAEEVADAIGDDPARVEEVLKANVTTGRVADLNGKYTLMPGGRMIVKGEYSRHFADVRSSEPFLAAYERFERVNEEVKALITSWQVRQLPSGEAVTNDHSDRAYDEKVIDRLGTLHERFEPTLQEMCTVVPRLQRYADKLDAALHKAEQGDRQWVSDVNLPSFHTVWFEMHEDLLCMLGKVRVE
jgi:hypothetical protein